MRFLHYFFMNLSDLVFLQAAEEFVRVSESVIVAYRQLSTFSAIKWQEQVTFH